jgi:hypothetical protein
MAYTTINKSTDFFDTLLWTGNAASSRAITGLNFQPDWSWVKNRDNAGRYHVAADAVRGSNGSGGMNLLYPNDSQVQNTSATDNFKTLDSNGFTIGGDANVNSNGENIVAWNWKAGGAGSANTDGSINSTVSANTTSGFSIVTYTGTGSNATVGHGLGAVPKMIIVKEATGSANDWTVYHATQGNTTRGILNEANAWGSNTAWNNTTPTSSFFSIGSGSVTNRSGSTYVAYCFAEKTGYSKIGSFTGTGNADGAFIYTGFKPTFLIFKNAGVGSESWEMFDTKRDNINVSYKGMHPNTSGAELTNTAQGLDILSNGFKARANENRFNDDQNTIIYMAFGQSLVGSNNVPCTAR